jgi:hypothetical protein
MLHAAMTSIGVGKPHRRLTEERSMMRVVEKLEVLGSSTLNPLTTSGSLPDQPAVLFSQIKYGRPG